MKESSTQEIMAIYRALKESPIFAMSLGSKELFHSNFWGWLFAHDEKYAKIFFKDISDYTVKREEKNRDLTLWAGGKAYVIENKIKALPTEEQLNKYQTDLSGKFEGGVITGIIKPPFVDNNGEYGEAGQNSKWRFLSYESIGKKILQIVGCDAGYTSQLIREYATMICNLSQAVITIVDSAQDNLLQNNVCKAAEDIRMGDVCKKINADRFVQYLNQHLRNHLEHIAPVGYDVLIRSDFSNKASIIDIRFVLENNHALLGIQIQGGQYRRCAQINEKLDHKTVFDRGRDAAWFTDFNSTIRPKTIWGNATSLRNEYGKYCTDNYSFVYQYWNIQNYSFDALLQQISGDMIVAAEIANQVCK